MNENKKFFESLEESKKLIKDNWLRLFYYFFNFFLVGFILYVAFYFITKINDNTSFNFYLFLVIYFIILSIIYSFYLYFISFLNNLYFALKEEKGLLNNNENVTNEVKNEINNNNIVVNSNNEINANKNELSLNETQNEIKLYVERYKDQYTKEAIKEALLNSGKSEEDINKVFEIVYN